MRRLSFFISEQLDAGLKALKVRDGVAEAESIRRALAAYLKEKGVLTESSKPRPKGRK
jgi:ribosomal protein S15P/S13E